MDNLMMRWCVLILTVREGVDRDLRVGHMLMQKLVYMLQSAFNVDFGYRYKLHYYGPYSDQLWSDLKLLSDIDVLKVQRSPDGYGYLISLGEAERYELFLANYDVLPRAEITQLIDVLGPLATRELELIATTHLVSKDLERTNRQVSEQGVATTVKRLKPHFSRDDVNRAMELLNQHNW